MRFPNRALFPCLISLANFACQSIPNAEMIVVPGPKGVLIAESTSYSKVEALKGAKYISNKECEDKGQKVVAGGTTFKDLRQKKPTEGLAGAAAVIFKSNEREMDSFSASMKFVCR